VGVADILIIFVHFIKKWIGKNIFSFDPNYILLIGFSITMVLLLSLIFVQRLNLPLRHLSIWRAFIIGIAQSLAYLVVGLSRFGVTYVVGRWLGLSARRSFQFSFLIQFPLITGAFLINGVSSIFNTATPNLFSILIIGVTIIAGYLFSLIYKCAIKEKLWWFGIYMVVPILFLILVCFR
jgi:undecaprenyl-diphosphatase